MAQDLQPGYAHSWGLMLLVSAWGNSRGPCSGLAPGGLHALAMTPADPPSSLSGWHCGGGCLLPGGWHVGGAGMGWGEYPEFVCLGEEQGVSRGFVIHQYLTWGIFYPLAWSCSFGTKRGFLC